ncbi:hypothetical protein ABH897_005559 [Paenibacillus sp. RC73]|uniref:YfiT family bacillithiol transferase n=1 Tax=Paenibacillus sp. RC73 TaxID=3156250 RepID=UPI003837A26F
MDQIKYPIGQFQPKNNLSNDEIIYLIKQIPELIKRLNTLLIGLEQYQLETPYRPNGWTVKQVIHHLADNDMNAYLRFKRGLTENNPLANTYREDSWGELIDYKKLPVENSLSLIEILHHRFLVLLKELSIEEYKRTIQTEVLGIITLETAIQRFIWHHKHHASQIENLIRREKWKDI